MMLRGCESQPLLNDSMTTGPPARLHLLSIGVPLLFAALVLQSITLASEHYELVLMMALLLTGLADWCFIKAFVRGGWLTKIASVALLTATAYIIGDFVRRAPALFR